MLGCFEMGLEIFLCLLLPLGHFDLDCLRLPLSFAVSLAESRLSPGSHVLLLVVGLEWVFLLLGFVG